MKLEAVHVGIFSPAIMSRGSNWPVSSDTGPGGGPCQWPFAHYLHFFRVLSDQSAISARSPSDRQRMAVKRTSWTRNGHVREHGGLIISKPPEEVDEIDIPVVVLILRPLLHRYAVLQVFPR
jgi:hypothetical protein